ncbi:MAG: 3-isopropylmalate dehydratase small subunit [Actinomycetia bacterium]|nr:3-isopropylmalate dehydratase small subunit [Actinomycetes bacterium]
MDPVGTISGRAAPLPRANVDTDQIIPKQFLKRVERSGFGEYLFYDWAADHEGEPDPEFVLNQRAYRDAVVLVAGPNFGSGSSREHAPWSLQDWGFDAIIAPSFADIFYTNCTKIGLLPVVLAEDEVTLLTAIATDPTNVVTIDLEHQTVEAPDFVARFEIDEFTKHCLMNGLDSIDLTLAHTEEIASFEGERATHKPVVSLDAADPPDIRFNV